MHFIANISSDRNLHGDKLRVKSCVNDLSELAKTAHFGGQAVKVDHLVLWGLSRHFGVFGVEGGCGEEAAFGESGKDGSWCCGQKAWCEAGREHLVCGKRERRRRIVKREETGGVIGLIARLSMWSSLTLMMVSTSSLYLGAP